MTGIYPNPLPYSLRMQEDGNLVIYDKNNNYLWNSGISNFGISPFRLVLQNDGVLAIVDATDLILWRNKINKTTFNSTTTGI